MSMMEVISVWQRLYYSYTWHFCQVRLFMWHPSQGSWAIQSVICHMGSDTGEHAPPQSLTSRPVLDWPTLEGWEAELTLVLVIYSDGLPVRRVTYPSSNHLIATRPRVKLTTFRSSVLTVTPCTKPTFTYVTLHEWCWLPTASRYLMIRRTKMDHREDDTAAHPSCFVRRPAACLPYCRPINTCAPAEDLMRRTNGHRRWRSNRPNWRRYF